MRQVAAADAKLAAAREAALRRRAAWGAAAPPLSLAQRCRDPLSPVREAGGRAVTAAGAQPAAMAKRRITFGHADDNLTEEDHATGAKLTDRCAWRVRSILRQ